MRRAWSLMTVTSIKTRRGSLYMNYKIHGTAYILCTAYSICVSKKSTDFYMHKIMFYNICVNILKHSKLLKDLTLNFWISYALVLKVHQRNC